MLFCFCCKRCLFNLICMCACVFTPCICNQSFRNRSIHSLLFSESSHCYPFLFSLLSLFFPLLPFVTSTVRQLLWQIDTSTTSQRSLQLFSGACQLCTEASSTRYCTSTPPSSPCCWLTAPGATTSAARTSTESTGSSTVKRCRRRLFLD